MPSILVGIIDTRAGTIPSGSATVGSDIPISFTDRAQGDPFSARVKSQSSRKSGYIVIEYC